ncbi:MAG: hypothetical protein QGH07_13370 [Alphaproteobacteria bacterium]|nr:hypothetical protein [Alphaproteobacteria bacterium]
MSQASTNFKVKAAAIRAEDERSERLIDITAEFLAKRILSDFL